MKLDVSKAVKETSGWDEQVSGTLHDKWIDNFWTMQKLRGLQFQRARIPGDAVDTKMYLTGCVDAADSLKIVGVWARFRRKMESFLVSLSLADPCCLKVVLFLKRNLRLQLSVPTCFSLSEKL